MVIHYLNFWQEENMKNTLDRQQEPNKKLKLSWIPNSFNSLHFEKYQTIFTSVDGDQFSFEEQVYRTYACLDIDIVRQKIFQLEINELNRWIKC